MTFDPSIVIHFGQGFYLPNLVGIGHSWVIWPLVDPGWKLHDLWPSSIHYILARGFSYLKFGTHGPFQSNWPLLDPDWPCMTFDPSIALHFCQEFGSHRAFPSYLTPGWPQLALAWPLTPTMHYTSARGSSYQIWWAWCISKAIWPLDDIWLLVGPFQKSSGAHSLPPCQVSARYLKARRNAKPYIHRPTDKQTYSHT